MGGGREGKGGREGREREGTGGEGPSCLSVAPLVKRARSATARDRVFSLSLVDDRSLSGKTLRCSFELLFLFVVTSCIVSDVSIS